MNPNQTLVALLLAKINMLENKLKYDSLTGAITQSMLVDMWHKEDSVTIIAIDVAGLKSINETQGHDKGDIKLQQVALDLKQCVRLTDCIYRRGGDEFVIIIPHCTYLDSDLIVNRIQKLSHDLYIGVVSGNDKLSILIQIAFSQVESQKKIRKLNVN